MPDTGSRNDPYSGFAFEIVIDGVTKAGFSECSGLSTETAVTEYRTGAEEPRMRALPGIKKYPHLVFKRGITQDKDLWKWRKKVLDGKTERQSGSVVLKDESGAPVLRWTFREGWPCKWEGPALNAKNSEVAIETLEIVHEELKLEE